MAFRSAPLAVSRRTLAAALVLAFALGAAAARTPTRVQASSQANLPAAATQSGRTPQFENDDVRVWRSLIAPNVPLTLHRHDHPRIIVALSGGTMNLVSADGRREVHSWETGHAYWLPSMPPGALHADVNAGTTTIDVMVIELKNAM